MIGGTGFLGSYIVDELVRRGEYYAYVLGRTFRPERTNPNSDCLIQVDLLDLDGLVNALQGVESIIVAASVLPSLFTTVNDIRTTKKTGQDNVLRAAKKAGVKNIVFVAGSDEVVKDPIMAAFMDMFKCSKENVLKENGIDGVNTCAVSPGNIIGLNKPFLDSLVSGEMKSMAMTDVLPVSFLPVEYVAKAIVNAESKLATGDMEIAGKELQLLGEVMSWKQFLSLPTWPNKISENPMWALRLIVKINVFCALVFGKAPFGAELTPGFVEVLSLTEKEMTESECQHVYDVLGVGPPTPPMEQYVKEMVDRYKKRKEMASKEASKDK